jgi:hypothetical protein
MKRERVLLFLPVVFFLAGPLYAQPWSGVLGAGRAIDWSSAGAGPLPNRSTICASWFAGSGTPGSGTGVNGDYYWRTDTSAMFRKSGGAWGPDGRTSAADMNTSIATCGSGNVVYLNPGAYTLSGSIVTSTSNVTVRGSGADTTSIVWSATNSNCNGLGAVAFCIFNGDTNTYVGNASNAATWTAGYGPGITSITLGAMTAGGISSLHVGSLIVLDQQDDPTDPGADIFVCQTSGSNGSCSQQGANGTAKAGRAQSQQVTVTSISGNGPWTIGISPGLYAPNWSASRSPEAWWSGTLPVSGFGIENLTLDAHLLGDSQAIVEYTNVTKSWIKGIRSINGTGTRGAARKHVLVWQSARITVRDSYFYGSSPTSEGYGVDFSSVSADNLCENNIFQHVAAGTLAEVSVGDVFAYNYAVDNYYDNGAPNWQGGDGTHHQVGDYYLLWEGHEGIQFNADSIHGTAFFITHFRNYLNGHDVATEVAPKTQATWAYFLFSGARYFNLIGNVLGTQSYHVRYTTQSSSTTDCGNANTSYTSVIVLGYSDQNGINFSAGCSQAPFTIPNDMTAATTLMRWGNYVACSGDAACNAVRFVNAEVPSGLTNYRNTIPASQNLPASFYLASKPSWWGTMPWPAVGPDVTGGNVAGVGGHVYHNPAANCYLNVMGGLTNGFSGTLTFNAGQCYGTSTGTPPAAPQNLAIIPG